MNRFLNKSPNLRASKRIVFSPYGVGHRLPWVSVAQKIGLNLPWITIPSFGNFTQLFSKSLSCKDGTLVIGLLRRPLALRSFQFYLPVFLKYLFPTVF